LMAGLYAPEGGTGTFQLPSEGVVRAVCADVIDLGIRPGWEGKPTHKIALVFQIDENDDKDGKPLQVQQWFTLSMNDKANLKKFLESWRGKKFEMGEAGQFDLYKLVGAGALLTLVHGKPNQQNRVYANIQSISPMMKGMEPLQVRDYVRREPKDNQQNGTQGSSHLRTLPGQQNQNVPEYMKPKNGDPF
jgi:hypothetical protein